MTTDTARPMLLGLLGRAGVGKDTVALVLCSAGWRSIAFADALRWEIADHWRIDPRLLTERATKETPLAALAVGQVHDARWLRWCAEQGHNMMTPRSPRWVMQQWGQWRRQQDADHWLLHVRVWARDQRRAGACQLVVTDVRHENEAACIRALGGQLVRVHRPGLEPLAADTAAHISEQHHHIHTDADLHNDGSLADLHHEVWRVVRQLAGAGAGDSLA